MDSLVGTISRRGIGALVMGAALALSARAGANSLTISLPDIGNFAIEDVNTADTYTGSGFLGIYPNLPNDLGPTGPAFVNRFGLEYYNGIYSATELQASLAGLSGAIITSAFLNFSLSSGSSGSESVKVTSFTTTGTLGFNTSAPNNLGTVIGAGIKGGANSIDVTTLVTAAVLANQTWLGLYLTPEGPGDNFLYTFTDMNPDAAGLEIVINYTSGNSTPVSVPDTFPTVLLLGIGLGFMRCAAVRLKLQPN
jgi:hypothetical protein